MITFFLFFVLSEVLQAFCNGLSGLHLRDEDQIHCVDYVADMLIGRVWMVQAL